MKTRIFTIILIGGLILLGAAAFVVNSQMRAAADIDLDTLGEHIYTENSRILTWALGILDDNGKLEDLGIPESWAEIFVVDNQTLRVLTSTERNSAGAYLHAHARLLDQAGGIIAGMQQKKPATLATTDYMVAVVPRDDATTLIGLKPKAWERDLIGAQQADIARQAGRIRATLLIFLCGGLLLVVLLALTVSTMATRTNRKIVGAFEALSLGDFAAEAPAGGKGDEMSTLSESYQRIRTSLQLALDRLGDL